MATTNTDENNPSLFETFNNKLNTIRSNRSLVAANQQLRIQLAFAKAEINRLQNEIVDLQRRITGLESTSDEERIEMIVKRRLQQRVQHLKSIANRTMQYMEKTKADFDHAAGRLDHITLSNNFDTIYGEEASQSVGASLSCGTEDEIVGRNVKRPSPLEAVEEDVYGEMDENEDIIFDRNLIMPINGDGSKRLPVSRTSSRNNRRETFFVKEESREFDDDTETSFIKVSFPETNQTVYSSSTQNHEDPPAIAVLTEPITPTTFSVLKNPTVFSKLETPTASFRSRSLKSKAAHDESTPARNSKVRKSEIVTHSKTKRKFAIDGISRSYKKSSKNNAKVTKETSKLLIMPSSKSSTGVLSASNLNESVRCKRAAAAKIPSFKEPSLVTKMRNPNVN